MESKEYFEKVMQDYNQNRNGRSLRKYCKDEAVDYDWLIEFENSIVIITGTAGFIGFHLAKRLLRKNRECHIIGIDNMND